MRRRLVESLLELAYPSDIYCICCGGAIDPGRPYALCASCASAIHWANRRVCASCGRILAVHRQGVLCGVCREKRFSFERGFSCVQYGLMEKEMLHRFKYQDQAYYGEMLGQLMYERILPEEPGPVLIVAVPMNPRRERERGYNQAALLAQALSRRLGQPFCEDLLERWKDTVPMSRLGRGERSDNIKGAFRIKPGGEENIQGKNILLIDDILTTGSTAEASAAILLKGGAARVWLLTFAAVPDWSDAGTAQVCG